MRSLESHKLNFTFILLILLTKFSSIFLSLLYDRKVPNTLIESFVVLNVSTLELHFFIVPNHIALVFFSFNFQPDTVPNDSIIYIY